MKKNYPRIQVLEKVQVYGQKHWNRFCSIYPELKEFPIPILELNGRFTRTAGMCMQRINTIELAYKLFAVDGPLMLHDVLAHEIAHQVDYNLFGESEKRCGHGKRWVSIMKAYGLKPLKAYEF